MKIKADELRKFLNTSGLISPNPLASYLDSILIECIGNEIILTKTNNNIWCQYKYVCQDQEKDIFLINEKTINGILQTCNEYEISIESKNNDCIITSGESVLKSRKQDINNFPKFPVFDHSIEKIKISKETLSHIKTASKFISKSAARNAFSFVNICNDGIFSFDTMIAYYHNTSIPGNIFLDHEPLAIIKPVDDLFYWSHLNYDFFQLDGFLFGFIKSEVKAVPFLSIVNQTGETFFYIKKIDLYNFCIQVQAVKYKDQPYAFFEKKNDRLVLSYIDERYNIELNFPAEIETEHEIGRFEFNVDSMTNMVKSLPYEQLIFTKLASNHYSLTTPEDDKYKGIIARLKGKDE